MWQNKNIKPRAPCNCAGSQVCLQLHVGRWFNRLSGNVPLISVSHRTYHRGAWCRGRDMIETSFAEKRQTVSDDLDQGQRVLTGSNIRWGSLGRWAPAVPHLISECWRSVGYFMGDQRSSQEFSGGVPIREKGSYLISLNTFGLKFLQ